MSSDPHMKQLMQLFETAPDVRRPVLVELDHKSILDNTLPEDVANLIFKLNNYQSTSLDDTVAFAEEHTMGKVAIMLEDIMDNHK